MQHKKLLSVFSSSTFWAYFFGTILLAFSILFFAYHLAYARKIIPGVKVSGLSLGNKTQEGALDFLRPRLVEVESTKLIFVHEGNKFSKSFYEWGLNLEATSSAQKAFAVGRSGNFFENTKDKYLAWFEGINLSPVISVDEEVFSGALSEVQEVVNVPAQETRYQIVDDSLVVMDGTDGQSVNRDIFRDELLKAVCTGNFNLKGVPTEPILATPPEPFENKKSEVEKIVFSKPKIVFGSKQWVLEPEQVLALLDFEYVEVTGAGNPVVRQELKIKIETTVLNTLVADLSQEVNRPVRGGTFALENGRVIDFCASRRAGCSREGGKGSGWGVGFKFRSNGNGTAGKDYFGRSRC